MEGQEKVMYSTSWRALTAVERNKFLLGCDPGIRLYVGILLDNGLETIQSCEGGDGHAYELPTVEVTGGPGAGYHALAVAMDHGLPVSELRYVIIVHAGHLERPCWQLVFTEKSDIWDHNQTKPFMVQELLRRRARGKRRK